MTKTITTRNPVSDPALARLGDLLAQLTLRQDDSRQTWPEGMFAHQLREIPACYAGKGGRERFVRDIREAGSVQSDTRSITYRSTSRATPTLYIDHDGDAALDRDLDALYRERFPYDYYADGAEILDDDDLDRSIDCLLRRTRSLCRGGPGGTHAGRRPGPGSCLG